MVIFSRGWDDSKAGEGLRLVAAMLGMDQPPIVVFMDDGLSILEEGALEDPLMNDYLTTSSDLVGFYAIETPSGVIDPELDVTDLTTDELAEMVGGCKAVVAY